MKLWKILTVALLANFSLQAQSTLADDFSDGDFTDNPAWTGDTGKFVVLNQRLQLYDQQAASSNEALLMTAAPTSLNDSTSWEFFVQLDFAPSTSNHARIYLACSQADPTAPNANGYYLKIGGISGSEDALTLYRQDGETHTALLSGSAGAVGEAPATARVRISRNREGHWRLRADYQGGSNWQYEGETTDTTYPQGDYFGWLCKYTSTRNEDFFLDDLLITPLFQDTFPPRLLALQPLSPDSLLLTFDEPLEEVSASDPAHYLLSPGGPPSQAWLSETDPTQVFLILFQPMQHLQFYSLSANAISDEEGNISDQQQLSFTFYDWPDAQPYQLLINEIMADPKPAIALPEAEYIELYNNSGQDLQLEGYSLQIGDKTRNLQHFLLPADSLLLICDEEVAGLFAPLGLPVADSLGQGGKCMPIPDMPVLPNAGTEIRLFNREGTLLHSLTYSDDWYGSNAKKEGGWSLEMRNPRAACRMQGNWTASEDLRGGSPGRRNSVHLAKADSLHASCLQVYPLTDQLLQLTFDKALSPTLPQTHFSIQPGITIDSIYLTEGSPNILLLSLAQPLQNGTLYELQIADELTDCLGLPVNTAQKLSFGLPEEPEEGDILINELLYEPQSGGKDFIELYNASDKILSLDGLLLANLWQGSDSIQALQLQYLLLPDQRVALTESPSDILQRYQVPHPKQLLSTQLPVFAPPEGLVSLMFVTPQGTLREIDRFPYSDELHNPLLADTRGTSLERISPLAPTDESENWTSTAQSAGGATPTGENSQRVSFAPQGKKQARFYTEYRLFSPDGDGYRDLLPIRYDLQQNDASINLLIFDLEGRLRRQLLRMHSIGSRGTLYWAGEDDSGQRLPRGTYLIWVECFFPNGQVEQHKLSCLLNYH